MKKVLVALAVTVCFVMAGCAQQSGGQQSRADKPLIVTDSYTADGSYMDVLTRVRDKMDECGRLTPNSQTYLDTAKKEAYFFTTDKSGKFFFKIEMRPQGAKKTLVKAYTPQGSSEWDKAAETAKRGALGMPGCPTKE